jgi:hypothetical protein
VGYRIAEIDVHKMLAVVVADIAIEGEYDFDRRQFGASPDELRRLADWLIEQKVQEVMESTAQYWRPVWQTLERYWQAACRSWEGAVDQCPDRCSSRRCNPIAARVGARRTSSMPNAFSSGWWRRNLF